VKEFDGACFVCSEIVSRLCSLYFDFIFQLPSGERDEMLMEKMKNPSDLPSARRPGSGRRASVLLISRERNAHGKLPSLPPQY